MSKQNHLVVGVNGTIGSALFSKLKEKGVAVFGTSQRQATAEQDNIYYVNLLDETTWQFDRKFDVVYFCAGMCRMALCEDDPVTTRKVNIDATLKLSKQLSEQGAQIIFLSTNQVFSGDAEHVAADSKYSPANEYGKQKAEIESLLKKHINKLAIVRLTKVVEPNMQLIDAWIQDLVNDKPVNAFKDMMLAPVTLRQVVAGLIEVGMQQQTGIFQISGEKDISYFELASYLAEQLQKPQALVQSVSALEKGMRKSFLPRFTSLDCSSIIMLTGTTPPQIAEVIQESFTFN